MFAALIAAMLKSLNSRQNDAFLVLLRQRRESQQLRQADLALRLGRGQATVSKVERGVRRLDIIELRAWLKALDIDFLTFMSELDDQLEGMPVPDARFRAHHAPQGRRIVRPGVQRR